MCFNIIAEQKDRRCAGYTGDNRFKPQSKNIFLYDGFLLDIFLAEAERKHVVPKQYYNGTHGGKLYNDKKQRFKFSARFKR